MAELKKVSDARQEVGKGESNTTDRGIQYPADNLAVAIGNLEKVRAAVGFGSASRDILANALGFKSLSGHAARRLGAMSHFGLLDRAGTGAARISELGKRILMPTSAEEKLVAIAEAAKSPNLYAALVSRFAGQSLPQMLANLLVRDHGVHVNAKDDAVEVFRESLEFAGLLRNGIVHESPLREHVGSTPDGQSGGGGETDGSRFVRDGGASPEASGGAAGGAEVVRSPRGELTESTILLDGSGRAAIVQLPVPITQRDLRKIKAWLSYMSSVLEDDETPDLSGN